MCGGNGAGHTVKISSRLHEAYTDKYKHMQISKAIATKMIFFNSKTVLPYRCFFFFEQQWAKAATDIASFKSPRTVKARCEGTRCSHSSWEAEVGSWRLPQLDSKNLVSREREKKERNTYIQT